MCGIIAYSGNENAEEIILNGLQALEYRGYDSAGMTVFSENKPLTIKTNGRVFQLKNMAEGIKKEAFSGIGHTRWATHGKPNETNAHPQTTKLVSVVHNGIIENYAELREKLIKKGYNFVSETDTEVAAMLIHDEYKKMKNPKTAIISSAAKLKGSYALCIIYSDIPDCVFAIKQDSPLILGKNQNGHFIASDFAAFSDYTDTFYRMKDGEISEITKSDIRLYNPDGDEEDISWEKSAVKSISENMEKKFRHFMIKEINEEPEALKRTFFSLTNDFLPDFSGEIPDDFFSSIRRFHITACGTAYHAGLIGKYYIEKIAGIPVSVETAGEFRYNEPVTEENEAVIIISQSGETADSLAALRLMKKRNIPVISIINSNGSTIEAESDYVIKTRAGREISVASTKAFSVQIMALLIFACRTAIAKNRLTETDCRTLLKQTQQLFCNDIEKIITDCKNIIKAAHILSSAAGVFFIGRGYDSTLSLEASLKLKEITYINSQGYPAAELKHGTISLIEEGTPVVVLATDRRFFEKMRSNIEEVKSRGAFIISVCPSDAEIIKEASDISIGLPVCETMMTPFLTATAIQLLAYYTADIMGRDIDKPRNLAKSVTVE